jgi:molybdenum-dependent DNA-binding transcriptional regulator ModE
LCLRVITESLSLSEAATRLGSLSRHINEGLSFIESISQRIFGTTVDGGKTVGTHDTTTTTRGADVSKTVKTYKTDKTSRGD